MRGRTIRLAVAAALGVALLSASTARALSARYLYSLATINGTIPFSGIAISYDPIFHEIFAIGNGVVRIFNESGMQTFEFGNDPDLGTAVSVSALPDGDLMTLTVSVEGKPQLVRCNYRGEIVRKITLGGLPQAAASFQPSTMRVVKGRMYLANTGAMQVVVADLEGKVSQFFDVYDMTAQYGDDERMAAPPPPPAADAGGNAPPVPDDAPSSTEPGHKTRREEVGIRGFNVAPNGDILFTIQPFFKAFILSLDGQLRAFGRKGSGPGKFNVVAGIAADDEGRLYVADLLKSAVIVFDKNLRFLSELGFRGRAASSIFAPTEVSAGDGKLYVSQYGQRGVSVFSIAN